MFSSDVFLVCQGKEIYHVPDPDSPMGVSPYCYTTDPEGRGRFEFDVRELPECPEDGNGSHVAVIRAAVTAHQIRFPSPEEVLSAPA